MILGFGLPIAAFEIYRWRVLVGRFGWAAWWAINEDMKLHFVSSGSGLNLLSADYGSWQLFWKKLAIWLDIGILPLGGWVCFGLLSLILLTRVENSQKPLIILLVASAITNLAWFSLLSPFGWARHAWLGLILGMVLISAGLGRVINLVQARLRGWPKMVVWSLILLIFIGIFEVKALTFKPLIDEAAVKLWFAYQSVRGLQGFPPNPIIPLKDQIELVEFCKRNVKASDLVYYLGWFLVAEAATLGDKVFYTIDRYLAYDQYSPTPGRPFLIFGPYQQGVYSFKPPTYLAEKLNQLCLQVVFQNPSYLLCRLQTGITYLNHPYD